LLAPLPTRAASRPKGRTRARPKAGQAGPGVGRLPTAMRRARGLSFGLWLGLVAVARSGAGQPAQARPAELELNRPERNADGKPGAAHDEPQANVIVPLLLYTPETHVGFGGLFVHFFRPPPDKKERVSSFAFFAIGTTRRQAILEAHPDFYL